MTKREIQDYLANNLRAKVFFKFPIHKNNGIQETLEIKESSFFRIMHDFMADHEFNIVEGPDGHLWIELEN